MKIRELSILDPAAIPTALEALHGKAGVIMLQMPAVYVLIAPATRAGAAKLDLVKRRQPMKNYGTAIGELSSFHAMAMPGQFPAELTAPESLNCLSGAFIRMAVGPEDLHSSAVRGGTHQGVLVEGPHRELFKAIEHSFAKQAEPALFGGHRYTAPLCTSANWSGDPLGSITDWGRAAHFAKERHLGLIIRCEPAEGEAGSYPIFHFKGNTVSIERHGPGEADIIKRLPSRLFARKRQPALAAVY